jgi:xanthine/uracil permease
VLILFNGEKTAIFWIGLVVFGYSIYEFCSAGFFILNYSVNTSLVPIELNPTVLNTIVPPIIGGIIFLVIGLYIMKAGIRRNSPQKQE